MTQISRQVFIALLMVCPTSSLAGFEITEVYPGLFGSDGTADWFEITNLGASTASTTGLHYTNTGDPTQGVPLPSLDLRAGESAVILVENVAERDDLFSNSIEELYARWGTGFQAVALNNGPRLSNGGDEVWLFDGFGQSAALVDLKPVSGDFMNSRRTIEFFDSDVGDVGVESQAGINAAFRSEPFFSGNEIRQLTGSPGRSELDPVGARLEITEAYAGVFGSDGTRDWFEVTNVGGRDASTAGIFYRSSDDNTNLQALPALTLAPDESVVFITEQEAQRDDLFSSSLEEFRSLWGDQGRVEVLDNAGRIIANDLTLSLLDGQSENALVLDAVEIPSDLSVDFREEVYHTIRFTPGGEATASLLGDSVSRESEAYENSACAFDCPSTTPLHTIAGSPGRTDIPFFLPGDLNDDGVVNTADYPVWRDAINSGSLVSGDADYSGRIDGRDIALWRANVGRTRPTGTLDPPFGVIPEPSSLACLLAMSFVGLLLPAR